MSSDLICSQLEHSVAGAQWRAIGTRHHHGPAVMLSALRSSQSGGIGEYRDLIPLIDWCRQVGFDTIQLLPLNDTGPDPSPYNLMSASALHPVYLALDALPDAACCPSYKETIQQLRLLARLPRTAYHAVLNAKLRFLREYWNLVGSRLIPDDTLEAFRSNREWVTDYVRFKARQDKDTANDWHPSLERFHLFVQLVCDQQLREVRQYADSHDCKLMGDLPILLSPDSADVWAYPELFWEGLRAGAPPDQYTSTGQDWGFPIYNWEHHLQGDLNWWQRRLISAEAYYHICRFDHVVGFYRLWAMEANQTAREGRFVPDVPEQWLSQGDVILKTLLRSSRMLPVGEDLGDVPSEVRGHMLSLGVCGTKVMRWERDWHITQDYLDPQDYEPNSVTTLSTHDSEPLREWWERHPEEAHRWCRDREWNYHRRLDTDTHIRLLEAAHSSGSLFHLNPLQDYLSLFPELRWSRPDQERINVPGTLNPRNWTYRYRPLVEELAEHRDLLQTLSSLVRHR